MRSRTISDSRGSLMQLTITGYRLYPLSIALAIVLACVREKKEEKKSASNLQSSVL